MHRASTPRRLALLLSLTCLALALPRDLPAGPVSDAADVVALQAAKAAAPGIRAVARHIDRILICDARPGAPTNPDLLDTPLVEIRGTEKAASFFEALDLAEAKVDGFCDCVGYYRFVFQAGEDYRYEVLLIGDDILQAGNGAPWQGDLLLSGRGKAQLRAWFDENGWDIPAREERHRLETQTLRTRESEKLRAWLPEKARSQLPDFEASVRGQAPALLDHWTDKAQGILALWEVVSHASLSPATSPASFWHGGPGACLNSSLSAATPQDLLAAEKLLETSGDASKAGAFLHAIRLTDASYGRVHDQLAGPKEACAEAFFRTASEPWRVRMIRRLLGDRSRWLRALALPEIQKTFAAGASPQPLPESRDGGAHADDYGDGFTRMDRIDDPGDIATDYLLRLAMSDLAQARTLVPKALASKALSAKGRRILEIFKALGAPDIKITHELIREGAGDGRLAELAFDRACELSGGTPPLALLATLAQSRHSGAAKAWRILRDHGLQLEMGKARESRDGFGNRIEAPPDGKTPAEQLAVLQRRLASASDEQVRLSCLRDLGDHHLRQGAYREALIAYRKAGDGSSPEAVLAALALGRLQNNAMSATVVHANDTMAHEAIQQALLACATGNFMRAARCFDCAVEIGGWDQRDECGVAAELCRRLAGMASSPEYVPTKGPAPQMGWHSDWGRLYLQGSADREAFLKHRIRERGVVGDAFAWWVLAQQARLAGDVSGERDALLRGIATNDHKSYWNALLRLRLRQLEEGFKAHGF